ncbi:hypothetical protein JCM14036_01630 [Desulfotomaculum defluvii]
MKLHKIFALLVALILITLTGCGSTETVKKEQDESTSIVFADKIFESYARQIIGKLSGDLTKKDFEGIKQVEFGIGNISISYHPYNSEAEAPFDKIDLGPIDEIELPKSSEDFKYFTNMEKLNASFIPTKNIEFVSHMPNLKYLKLTDAPNDLSPLKECTKLEYLSLDFSQVTDFSPLSSLGNLKAIDMIGGTNESEIEGKIKAVIPNVEIN